MNSRPVVNVTRLKQCLSDLYHNIINYVMINTYFSLHTILVKNKNVIFARRTVHFVIRCFIILKGIIFFCFCFKFFLNIISHI